MPQRRNRHVDAVEMRKPSLRPPWRRQHGLSGPPRSLSRRIAQVDMAVVARSQDTPQTVDEVVFLNMLGSRLFVRNHRIDEPVVIEVPSDIIAVSVAFSGKTLIVHRPQIDRPNAELGKCANDLFGRWRIAWINGWQCRNLFRPKGFDGARQVV